MDGRWSCAGRATAGRSVRWSRVSAGGVERCFAGVATMRRRTVRDGGGTMLRHGLVAGRPKRAEDGARSRMKRRSRSGRARALVPPRFSWRRPPAGRRSGEFPAIS
ncbi:scarecrow-like protein 15 [Dorcoceras hygrometricum]|uniref:Scarecrow-like protein 15 n=1 Tax=Dorcoceras hygrometricum TaxID=472368 RepID=A0A2Z6ZTU6_9LAMI|nr:scarecrow-like protein 15 [Dorcoceras hygrometricum]